MRKVVIESPFKGTTERTQEQHRAYLNHALQDAIRRGEAPFASHHAYPGVLDDDNLKERTIGIAAGLCWGEMADLVAIYQDMGVSPGMTQAIDHYKAMGKPIEYRKLDWPIVKAILEM